MKLPELLAKIEEKNKQVNTIFDAAGDDPLPKEKIEEVKKLNKEIEEMEVSAQSLKEQDDLRKKSKDRERWLTDPVRGVPLPGGGPESSGDRRALALKSLGERFVESEEFKSWQKEIAQGGHVPERVKVLSPALHFKGFTDLEGKTLVTGASDTSAGALVRADQRGVLDMGTWMRPLTIRDLITQGQTGSDAVEYIRHGTPTNNAAVVAEATATGGSSGVKPESALPMSIVTEVVKTIAHWIPATRRALADAAQIRSYVDKFLRYGLEEQLESQMLNGDGTGENFTGILNTTGTSSQAYDTSLIVTTRKARTKVQTLGRAKATGWVMHPNDWQNMDLLKDGEDRYYFGGPTVMGTPRLWGLPVVECEAMPEGTTVVADWRLAALWDREQAHILITDSHSDFFIRNIILVLAELRAAFGVLRPPAFVETDLTP